MRGTIPKQILKLEAASTLLHVHAIVALRAIVMIKRDRIVPRNKDNVMVCPWYLSLARHSMICPAAFLLLFLSSRCSRVLLF